jgi:hypothetical protein
MSGILDLESENSDPGESGELAAVRIFQACEELEA